MQDTHKIVDAVSERKARIRKRYEGIDQSRIKVIPAKQEAGLYEETEEIRRVAVYARVSTDDPNQTSSYELQKTYYEDMVSRNPSWRLVKIYADEGISGTSLKHRDEFVRLIDDAMNGEIDLIITKSVSRFARNLEDCIHFARQLANKQPPVGILFEAEGIYTLNDNSEMSLAMNATMAQEESHIKSVSMNRSIEMRFFRGVFLTPVLLGYDHDEDGDLIINKEEEKTVRLIFLMYLNGQNCVEIARELTRLKRLTKLGNASWSPGSIYTILRNERYCGDLLAHKTYTPSYLTHKAEKNDKKRPQYYVENHHGAIVSRADYVAVQGMLDQAKYGFQKALPELKVIPYGILRGFVQINPKWTGFKPADYLDACQSVLSDIDYLSPIVNLRVNQGDFDLRKFEVTRGVYAPSTKSISATICFSNMKFSQEAIFAFEDVQYIELLFHPIYELLVVRKGKKTDKHAVKWMDFTEDGYKSKVIKGKSFLPILFEFLGWDEDKRYVVRGYEKEQRGEKVLLFFVDEPEIRIKEDGKMRSGYRAEWKDSFGDKYLKQLAKAQSIFDPMKQWSLNAEGVIANIPAYEIRSGINEEIRELVTDFEQGPAQKLDAWQMMVQVRKQNKAEASEKRNEEKGEEISE